MLSIPKLTSENLRNFWRKIDREGINKCWLWTGYCDRDGYGQFGFDNKIYRAPRVALAIIGQRSNTLEVRHTCNNPRCVNPAHLCFGTPVENAHDRILAGTNPNGSRYGAAKLTETDIPIIRTLAKIRLQREIGDLFGVTQRQISHILTGKQWTHVVGVATNEEVEMFMRG